MDKLAFDMANKFYDVSARSFEADDMYDVKVRHSFAGRLGLVGVMAATVVLALPALILLPIFISKMVKRYKECKAILAEHPELRETPISKMSISTVVKAGLDFKVVRTYKHVKFAERFEPNLDKLEAKHAQWHAFVKKNAGNFTQVKS